MNGPRYHANERVGAPRAARGRRRLDLALGFGWLMLLACGEPSDPLEESADGMAISDRTRACRPFVFTVEAFGRSFAFDRFCETAADREGLVASYGLRFVRRTAVGEVAVRFTTRHRVAQRAELEASRLALVNEGVPPATVHFFETEILPLPIEADASSGASAEERRRAIDSAIAEHLLALRPAPR